MQHEISIEVELRGKLLVKWASALAHILSHHYSDAIMSDGVSNHQLHDCLLNRLFRRRSKKTSKLRVTGLCEGNSPVTGEFPAQTSNAEMFPFDDVIMAWSIPSVERRQFVNRIPRMDRIYHQTSDIVWAKWYCVHVICSLKSWRHDMEIFSVLPAIFTGNNPIIGGFSSQGAGDAEATFCCC